MEFEPGQLLQLGLGLLGGLIAAAIMLCGQPKEERPAELPPAPPQRRLQRVVTHRHPVRLEMVDETILPCCGMNLEDKPAGDYLAPQGADYKATCEGLNEGYFPDGV